MALEDLSERELNIGMRRALRQWNYTVIPPPAYIRECVSASLDEERSHIAVERMEREKLFELPPRRLTLEEAWADWEEVQDLEKEYRERFGCVHAEKRAEVKKEFSFFATKERVEKLQKQKIILEERYGKGKTIRVRDFVPPEANEGASGTERNAEECDREGTDHRTSDK